MPGLAGIVNEHAEPGPELGAKLDRMAGALRHFDDYRAARCQSACGRAAAWNISPDVPGFPLQQYSDGGTGVTVALDGEISNVRELAAESGAKLDGDNGAQLVHHLYGDRSDLGFLRRLNGWFNLVILDGRRGRIVLAGDRYGIRPMYWREGGGALFFCSQVAGILAALPECRDLDYAGVADYFAFDGPLNGRTMFKGVSRMPPAYLWVFADGRWDRSAYWSPAECAGRPKLGAAEARERAAAVFGKVVPRCLRGDYVMSLTGGNDSRLMASFLGDGDRPRYCFTYGVTSRSADVILARRVARVLGLRHVFVPMDGGFFRRYPEYAERAVLLSGGMGDVTSASILHVHAGHRNSACATGKYGTQIARGVRQKVWEMSGLPNLGVLAPELRESLRGMPERSLAEARRRYEAAGDPSDADLLFTIVEECRHHWGGKLAVENAMILVRSPFLDSETVEFTLGLPPAMRSDAAIEQLVIGKNDARLARIPTNRGSLPAPGGPMARAEAKLFEAWFLASTVANSRRVHPAWRLDETFLADNASTKFRNWFRTSLKDYVREIVLDSRTLSRGIFDPAALRRIVDEHIGRRKDHSPAIAKVICFELVHRLFLD